MIKILITLLKDFFEDAFPIVDVIFSKIIDMVFYVEKSIEDGFIFSNNAVSIGNWGVLFDNVFNVTTSFGIALLILKLISKLFNIYIGYTDGDGTTSMESIVIGFVKALVLIFSFKYLYGLFVDISLDLINKVLESLGIIGDLSLIDIFDSIFSDLGFFLLLGLLAFFICYLILIIQFIKRGLEMLILRAGFPFACLGLIDSDKGIFAPYMKIFIQNTATVLIQLAMIKLGFGILKESDLNNSNLFFGIGAMMVAIKTPQFLQQFMIGVGGGGINMMQLNASARALSSIRTIIRK